MSKKSIQLGDEIIDVVAKVTGIAHGRVEYLDGSVYWIIQPRSEDGILVSKEVHSQDAYCEWVSDGVRLQPKPPMGFHAREVDGNGSQTKKH